MTITCGCGATLHQIGEEGGKAIFWCEVCTPSSSLPHLRECEIVDGVLTLGAAAQTRLGLTADFKRAT